MARILKIVLMAVIMTAFMISPAIADADVSPQVVTVAVVDVQSAEVLPTAVPSILVVDVVTYRPGVEVSEICDYRGAVRAPSAISNDNCMISKKFREVAPRICDYLVESLGDVYCSVCVMRADKKQGRPQLE